MQQPGKLRGQKHRGNTKLTLILVGDPENAPAAEEDLYRFLDDKLGGRFVLRVNRIIETGDSTPVEPALGAFAEVWVDSDAIAQDLLNQGLLMETGPLTTCITMLVEEVILVEGPEY